MAYLFANVMQSELMKKFLAKVRLKMIIDSNLILWQGSITDSNNAQKVALNSLHDLRYAQAIPIMMQVTQGIAGATKVTIKIQHSTTLDGSYVDSGAQIELSAEELNIGIVKHLRFLPPSVSNPFIKLAITTTGTATAGEIFAAITREDAINNNPDLYVKA